MYQRILVPVDGSGHALRAVQSAQWLASQGAANGTRITLLHVSPVLAFNDAALGVDNLDDRQEEEGHRVLQEAEQTLQGTGILFETEYMTGPPAKTICAKAREGQYDLIVMGSRGLNLLSEILVGSVSHYVVQHAHCPVLIVK